MIYWLFIPIYLKSVKLTLLYYVACKQTENLPYLDEQNEEVRPDSSNS